NATRIDLLERTPTPGIIERNARTRKSAALRSMNRPLRYCFAIALYRSAIFANRAAETSMKRRRALLSRATVELLRRGDGIEQRKQQQAGEEAADMRLPGDLLIKAHQRGGAEPEQEVEAEPRADKHNDTPVAQRDRERHGWHLVRLGIGAPRRGQRTAPPEVGAGR